jgi:hypothetical protein
MRFYAHLEFISLNTDRNADAMNTAAKENYTHTRARARTRAHTHTHTHTYIMSNLSMSLAYFETIKQRLTFTKWNFVMQQRIYFLKQWNILRVSSKVVVTHTPERDCCSTLRTVSVLRPPSQANKWNYSRRKVEAPMTAFGLMITHSGIN